MGYLTSGLSRKILSLVFKGSNPLYPTVAIVQLAEQRIVIPPVESSNLSGHILL